MNCIVDFQVSTDVYNNGKTVTGEKRFSSY